MGHGKQLDEAVLLQALQQAMLDKIKSGQGSQNVINNLYGGGASAPSSGAGGGIAAQMGGGVPPGPSDDGVDPFDYLVDIMREDLPINPDTGKPMGWKKSVHRHREKKGDAGPPKKG